MKLTDFDLKKLYALAMTAAARAGAHIQSKVGEHRETNTKEGGNTLASQVVTEVDLESQQLILETLEGSIAEYELGLLTEESEDDSSRHESDCFWCIDPLDGTLPFIEGSPGYSVSIALVSRAGEPLLGVVRDPVNDETFHALKGLGAFKNGDPIPATIATEETKLTWLMDRSMKDLEIFPQVVEAMERLAAESGYAGLAVIDHAGAALNGSWVTQHAPAVYFKSPKTSKGGGSLWDFAASACVLQEWGQPPSDIYGKALDLNRSGSTFMNDRGILYASDSELSTLVQNLYREVFAGSS